MCISDPAQSSIVTKRRIENLFSEDKSCIQVFAVCYSSFSGTNHGLIKADEEVSKESIQENRTHALTEMTRVPRQ